MRAQAVAFGALPVTFPRVPDRREEVARALRQAAADADVIVTTGGISMGEYDCVKDVLDELGAERVFWRVAQKPAGPLGLWRLDGKPVFGVPGNPVAAMLVMEEYVRPLLRRMMGFAHLFRPERTAVLETPWTRRAGDDRLHFLRVLVREEGGALHARLSGPQGSGVLSSMARANALALIPGDVASIPAGRAGAAAPDRGAGRPLRLPPMGGGRRELACWWSVPGIRVLSESRRGGHGTSCRLDHPP